jgi:hypothetical protein
MGRLLLLVFSGSRCRGTIRQHVSIFRAGRPAVATTTITLPDDQLARLRILALTSRHSLDEVVREAVDAYLASLPETPTPRVIEPPNDIPDAEWQARFDAVTERIRQAGPTDLTPEEIEREITLAREEARHPI